MTSAIMIAAAACSIVFLLVYCRFIVAPPNPRRREPKVRVQGDKVVLYRSGNTFVVSDEQTVRQVRGWLRRDRGLRVDGRERLIPSFLTRRRLSHLVNRLVKAEGDVEDQRREREGQRIIREQLAEPNERPEEATNDPA